GELTFHIEGTYALYLIPKKLYSIGFIITKGKHIHNTPTHRELSRFRNKIHSPEFVFKQYLVHKVDGKVITEANFQGVFVQLPAGYHLLKKSIGISNDKRWFLFGVDPVQHLCP